MKDKWCLKRYGQSDQNLFIYNNTPSKKTKKKKKTSFQVILNGQ